MTHIKITDINDSEYTLPMGDLKLERRKMGGGNFHYYFIYYNRDVKIDQDEYDSAYSLLETYGDIKG